MDQPLLGALILVLLAALITIKQVASGSIFERPPRQPLLWLVNSFNLLFLVLINPLAALLLLTRKLPGIDPTSVSIAPPWLLTLVEIAGAAIYVTGFVLMGWALISLARNYQLGGSDPRAANELIARGPYAHVRHPMYTAALGIALGLSCLTQSLACFGAFLVYLNLILALIPVEEKGLRQAYGERYEAYRRQVKSLVPRVY